MKLSLIKNLRCPDCSGDIETAGILKSEYEEILEGSLVCRGCNSSFRISEGIPVLLPEKLSNVAECELRRNISEKAKKVIDRWERMYDINYFRKLFHLRVRRQLRKINSGFKPKILDIGIGWGAKYLPFNRDIDLFGVDFSYESLLVLKGIYERNGEATPELICGSLSALPLKNIKFDIVWSTQVYQHIPDAGEIEISFDYIIRELLKEKGLFIVDNLNCNWIRFSTGLRNVLKPVGTRKELEKEEYIDGCYKKYYTEKDFKELVKKYESDTKSNILYTENLFHPEIGLRPKFNFIAYADYLIQKTPFAKFLGRQISLIVEKN